MRYLICSLTTCGYLYPAVSMAEQLRDAGHDVAFATGKALSNTLQTAGFERIPTGPVDGDSFYKKFFGETIEIVRQVNHVKYACEQFTPDVIITTPLTLGPLVAARLLHIPVAVMGTAAYLWGSPSQMISNKAEFIERRQIGLIERLQNACNIFDVPLSNDEYDLHENNPLNGDLCLLRSIPELEDGLSTLPSNVTFAGDCCWVPDNSIVQIPELAAWLDNALTSDKPILFVLHRGQFGDLPDYWGNLAAVLKEMPVNVVVSTSESGVESIAHSENLFLYPDVPHQLILPFANAVVGVGTTSTLLNSLRHGLPMMLFSYYNEQPDIVERVEQSNTGICIRPFSPYDHIYRPETISMANLRQALMQLLDTQNSIYANARMMQTKFAQFNENHSTVYHLERLAALGTKRNRQHYAVAV